MKRFYKFLPLLFIGIFLSTNAQNDVNSDISQILEQLPKGSKTAIFIYDPVTSDTIYADNIYKSMIPASNTKLFTTTAAFNLLSPSFMLSTKILTDDIDISDSVINGNLYIKGFGNAMLTDKDIDTLAEETSRLGIKEITGKVIGDDSYFDKIYSREDWINNERANVKLPPVSAVSVNRNKIIISLTTGGKTGDPVKYTLEPECSFIDVNMDARITKFRSRPRVSLKVEGNKIKIHVSGGLKKRRYPARYALFVDSPPLFAAMYLHDRLAENGIKIDGAPEEGVTPAGAITITSDELPLPEMINQTNKESDNYLAENLFKILGAEYSGKEGNSFYATQAVLSFLDDNGIYSEGTAVVDGSGISRFNEVNVASIVSLLENVYFDGILFDYLYNSLSIAGKDGTLADRLYESDAYLNFRGKTGTLNGVSAVSGYLTTAGNRDIIISILMEFNHRGADYYRDIQDEIINLVAEKL